MSSLVLLNQDGTVVRRLQLVSLPDDYTVPEGMIASWRSELRVSSGDPRAVFGSVEPAEAHFYLGDAWGQVCRTDCKRFEHDGSGDTRYNARTLTITVQGTSAADMMKLRDHVLRLINTSTRWATSNDLNPKPKKRFLRKHKKEE